MSGKRNKSGFEYGGYHLLEPNAKYASYGAGYYDAEAGQTRRKSLGTVDSTEGQLRLIEYANAHPLTVKRSIDVERAVALLSEAQPLDAAQVADLGVAASAAVIASPAKMEAQYDMPLTSVFVHYFALKRASLTNPDRVRQTLANCLEVWGDITVSEISAEKQHQFIAALRKMTHADGSRRLVDDTILTRLNCLYAAIHFCQTHGLLRLKRLDGEPVLPPRLGVGDWLPPAQLARRGGKPTFEEVVKLFEVAATRERWWTYLIAQIGLVCRPTAALELTPDNVEFFTDADGREFCNVKLLAEFDEEGRPSVQSNKRRAVVRCAPTLAKWLKFWNEQVASRPASHDRTYVAHKGRALGSPKFFKEIVERAGLKLKKWQGAYMLRRFMLSWCANNGCPTEQRRVLGGHAFDKGPADVYVELEPGYLGEAAALIEKMFQKLAASIKGRSLLEPNTSSEPLAHGFKKRLPQELEEQPVNRYTAWFWEEFQGRAMRLVCPAWHERGIKMRDPEGFQRRRDTVDDPDNERQ